MLDDKSIFAGAYLAEEKNSDVAFFDETKKGVGKNSKPSPKKIPELIFDLEAVFPVKVSSSGSYLISGLGDKLSWMSAEAEVFLFHEDRNGQLFLVLWDQEEGNGRCCLFKGKMEDGLSPYLVLRKKKICCEPPILYLWYGRKESEVGLLILLDNCLTATVSDKEYDFAVEWKRIVDFEIS